MDDVVEEPGAYLTQFRQSVNKYPEEYAEESRNKALHCDSM